ncbi:MAG: CmcI family methyltransferase [Candidatus Hodarchaeota archaeon]
MIQRLKTELKKLQQIIYDRIFIKSKRIIEQFHILYYQILRAWDNNTFWFGTPIQKFPLDLWIYQEIIFKLKPDLIIECGTANGGSAYFLASLFDLLDNGRIITIDIENKNDRPKNKRITYLLGSSTSQIIVDQVKNLINDQDKILVILDSDHHKEHVLNELRIYSKFVTIGSYLIVEDTNLNGHPVRAEYGPGPMEAVKEFLKKNKNFKIDKTREKLHITFNPNGYLLKIK